MLRQVAEDRLWRLPQATDDVDGEILGDGVVGFDTKLLENQVSVGPSLRLKDFGGCLRYSNPLGRLQSFSVRDT